MRKNTVRLTETLLVALLATTGGALVGCEEGPVEETGEEVDEALDETEDELD